MTVAVAIDRRQVQLAKTLAAEIEASSTMRKRNYTGLNEPNRFFYGYCGEAAVVNWLRAESRVFRHVICTDGRSQNNEIFVTQGGARRHLEVKTASQPHHKMLMIPAMQVEPAAFYVAVRLESDPLRLLIIDDSAGVRMNREADPNGMYASASIMGWLSGDEVARLDTRMVKIRTKCADFMMLRHPNELIRQLDEGAQIR